jgi:hypothetical protein
MVCAIVQIFWYMVAKWQTSRTRHAIEHCELVSQILQSVEYEGSKVDLTRETFVIGCPAN